MLLLGAYHGLNPGMGWLFAVALGLQAQEGEGRRAGAPADGARSRVGGRRGGARRRRARCGAAYRGAARDVAAVLIGLGAFWLVRHRHPRWVRMQVGYRDLTLWSFLVASAHGAGVMVLPVLLGSEPCRRPPDRWPATITRPWPAAPWRVSLPRPSTRPGI